MSHPVTPVPAAWPRHLVRAAIALTTLWLLLAPHDLEAQSARDQSVGRTVRLLLEPWGFEPDEITIEPGPIAIEVVNKVGFPELDVRLEVEQSRDKSRTRLLQERFLREDPKWRNVFTLPAGEYIVSVGTNEKWVSRITVKSEGTKQ